MKEVRRTIAFGDIHGCNIQLLEVLDQINPTATDQFIFLGDYIDRGPEAQNVIQTIQKPEAVYLKGNHEVMFLSRWHNYTESAQLELLDLSGLTPDSVEWMDNNLDLFHETDTHLFVHAGFDSNKPLSRQTELECCWTRSFDDYSDWTDKTIVHGHTITPEPERTGNRLNINTGCGSGGYLTAYCLEEDRFYRSSISPGGEYDWESIRIELEQELREYEEFAELEVLDD